MSPPDDPLIEPGLTEAQGAEFALNKRWLPPSLDEVVDELHGLCQYRQGIWARLEIAAQERKRKLSELGLQLIKTLERQQQDQNAGVVPSMHVENYRKLDAAYRKHAEQLRWREAAERTLYTLRKEVTARRGRQPELEATLAQMSFLISKRRKQLLKVQHCEKEAHVTLQSKKLAYRRVRAGQQRELVSMQEVRRLQLLYYPRTKTTENRLTPYEFARIRFLKWLAECLGRFNLKCREAAAHSAMYRMNVLVPRQTKRQALDQWLDWHRAAVLQRKALAQTLEVGQEWKLHEAWAIWRFQSHLASRAKAWLARSRRSTYENRLRLSLQLWRNGVRSQKKERHDLAAAGDFMRTQQIQGGFAAWVKFTQLRVLQRLLISKMQEFHVKFNALRLGETFDAWIKLAFGGWRLDGKMKLAVTQVITAHRFSSKEIGAKLELIWKKMRGRSYTDKGQDWGKLFRYYDRDSNGFLSVAEFRYAVRTDCAVGEDEVSNKAIKELFDTIARESGGSDDLNIVGNVRGANAHKLGISYTEFRHFLSLSGACDIVDLGAAEKLAEFDAQSAKELAALEAKKAAELQEALAAAFGNADAEEAARLAFARTRKLAVGRLQGLLAQKRTVLRAEQKKAIAQTGDDRTQFFARRERTRQLFPEELQQRATHLMRVSEGFNRHKRRTIDEWERANGIVNRRSRSTEPVRRRLDKSDGRSNSSNSSSGSSSDDDDDSDDRSAPYISSTSPLALSQEASASPRRRVRKWTEEMWDDDDDEYAIPAAATPATHRRTKSAPPGRQRGRGQWRNHSLVDDKSVTGAKRFMDSRGEDEDYLCECLVSPALVWDGGPHRNAHSQLAIGLGAGALSVARTATFGAGGGTARRLRSPSGRFLHSPGLFSKSHAVELWRRLCAAQKAASERLAIPRYPRVTFDSLRPSKMDAGSAEAGAAVAAADTPHAEIWMEEQEEEMTASSSDDGSSGTPSSALSTGTAGDERPWWVGAASSSSENGDTSPIPRLTPSLAEEEAHLASHVAQCLQDQAVANNTEAAALSAAGVVPTSAAALQAHLAEHTQAVRQRRRQQEASEAALIPNLVDKLVDGMVAEAVERREAIHSALESLLLHADRAIDARNVVTSHAATSAQPMVTPLVLSNQSAAEPTETDGAGSAVVMTPAPPSTARAAGESSIAERLRNSGKKSARAGIRLTRTSKLSGRAQFAKERKKKQVLTVVLGRMRNVLLAKMFDRWFTLLLGGGARQPLVVSAIKGRAEAMLRAGRIRSPSSRAGSPTASSPSGSPREWQQQRGGSRSPASPRSPMALPSPQPLPTEPATRAPTATARARWKTAVRKTARTNAKLRKSKPQAFGPGYQDSLSSSSEGEDEEEVEVQGGAREGTGTAKKRKTRRKERPTIAELWPVAPMY